jgi:hypothetical protein
MGVRIQNCEVAAMVATRKRERDQSRRRTPDRVQEPCSTSVTSKETTVRRALTCRANAAIRGPLAKRAASGTDDLLFVIIEISALPPPGQEGHRCQCRRPVLLLVQAGPLCPRSPGLPQGRSWSGPLLCRFAAGRRSRLEMRHRRRVSWRCSADRLDPSTRQALVLRSGQ